MRKSVFALLAAILALAVCSVSFADAPDDGWDRCSEEWGEEHWENGEWDGALRGYVLCNTLTLRSEPSDSAPAICTLDYGAKLYVGFPAEDNDEWYDATYMADVHASGYVKIAYVLLEPYWFESDAATPIYAYPSEDAERVALMPRGKRVAVIRETDDYYVVSLRGAAGFILK